MSSTPYLLTPSSTRTTWSVSQALNFYADAEAGGRRRLPGVILRGSVTHLNRPPRGAVFFWLTDGADHLEAVVLGKRRGWLPEVLAPTHLVEVTGTLRRHRGSEPQIEVDRIHILNQDAPPAAQGSSPLSPGSTPAAKARAPIGIGTLGLVTSAGTAAFRDVLEVVRSRCPWVEIVHASTPVQGEGAAARMAEAILQLHTAAHAVDAILLCRGGATAPQEFTPFADALLLAVIRASRVPVYTGIGHAGDVTPACRAAVCSFGTPTLAAVSLLPDRTAIEHELDELADHLGHRLAQGAIGQGEVSGLHVLNHTSASSLRYPMGTLSAATLLGTALKRLRQAVRQLSVGTSYPAATDPVLVYAVAADLCLARTVLATSSVTLRTLDEASRTR